MQQADFPDPLNFEWDTGNRNKNYSKHGIANEEAEQVFFNKPLLVSCSLCLGKTNNVKALFISFTIRKEKIRIISCRPMNRAERKIYEKTQTNS